VTTPTTTAGTPRATPASLEHAGEFVTAAGLRVDEVTATRVSGHIDLDERHHTPWGIVHGGVYATAIESGASIGACAAVADRGQVAVGLTNTTHFLRSLTGGRVEVERVGVNSCGRWTSPTGPARSSPMARCACRTSRPPAPDPGPGLDRTGVIRTGPSGAVTSAGRPES
jgi:uncharacterized protein (TIGR00369 family)